jgi:hypothetical protein
VDDDAVLLFTTPAVLALNSAPVTLAPARVAYADTHADGGSDVIFDNTSTVVGRDSRTGSNGGDHVQLWGADYSNGTAVVAAFNLAESVDVVTIDVAALFRNNSTKGRGGFTCLDLWNNESVEIAKGLLVASVVPHGVKLYRIDQIKEFPLA